MLYVFSVVQQKLKCAALTNCCINIYICTGQFISPSGISDFCDNSSRDGHAEGEHVNRGRNTPNICPTLEVLDMSTLGEAADVNPAIKFMPHTLQRLAVESSDCLHVCRICGKSRGIGVMYKRSLM